MGRALRTILLPIVRICHRPTLEGIENLPTSGAYMLVANHSGGIATAEISCFAALYAEKVGIEKPIAGFAHVAAFSVWPISMVLRNLGAVPSTAAAGEAVLRSGVAVLIFPGGDHEASRPIWQAHRVDFNGRVGFLKMARKTRVPIVPMGIRGAHFTAPILWRSDWLLPKLFLVPWLLGLKRYPISLLGVLVAAAILIGLDWALPWRILFVWGWFATAALPLLAWVPATIRMRIGPAIAPEELFSEGDEPAPGELPAALDRVQGAVQALVSRRA